MDTTTTLEERFDELIGRDRKPTLEELEALYEDAQPITVEWILGEWAGGLFDFGHPAETQLRGINWAGKSFIAADQVAPIVCFDDDGRRFINRIFGGASLGEVEYQGAVTATMFYERIPAADHFRRVSDHVVIGAMVTQGAKRPGFFYMTRLEGETAPRPLEFVANRPPLEVTTAVLREPGDHFSIEHGELEAPRADEVLVRVAACGICHSDLLVARSAVPQQLPLVLGHEGAGVVEAVGAGVTDIAPGDRVVISYAWCGRCSNCARGRMAYCASSHQLNLSGCRPDGSGGMRIGDEPVHARFTGQSSFATHALAAARSVVPIPDDVPFEIAAPLGCGFQTGAGAILNTLCPEPGSSIAVFACGSVGLAAVMAAKVAGCDEIIAVDPQPQRRELALRVGATDAAAPEDVKELLAGRVDYAVDCIGKPEVVGAALGALATPGTCISIGIQGFRQPLEIDLAKLVSKGQTLRGAMEGDAVPTTFIPRLVDLWRQGRFPAEEVITTFPFEAINDAIQTTIRGEAVKAVLTF
jgi:Zn-dependent alcohol dehydrogenase